MMDWEDSSGSSSDEENNQDMWNVSKAVNNLRETSLTTSRGSMRGLQSAIQEGWLIQRGRDMCSFAHDRYRQAAQSEAMSLPDITIQKMSFRVRFNFGFTLGGAVLNFLVHIVDYLDDVA